MKQRYKQLLLFAFVLLGICYASSATAQVRKSWVDKKFYLSQELPDSLLCGQCKGTGYYETCPDVNCYQGKCLACKGTGHCAYCYGKGSVKQGGKKVDCLRCEDGVCSRCLGNTLCATCQGAGRLICKVCLGTGKK
ncbi:hypothetical protein FHS56_000144 [Thermonema lapsum]|uniref:Uncharacterized protein n=1 Tax=Thermonema lapsum TaxID=28195 RepID=A0A846MM96_9BACT|nr:hypothetical protein [Thermonema lapsum]NIK72658.1 hypothetical protein [Thermonema lapsum]